MMNKRNYQRELDALLTEIEKEHKIPRLFLHSCCAPCSSYVLEYLSEYFEITVFFYNPNISLEEEYRKRVEEIKRLVREMKFAHPVHIEEGSYDPQVFYERVKGMEKLPEGFVKPADRTKPWGTGHAVICAREFLTEPFAVINADDYYGKEAYVKVHDYLVREQPADDVLHICMAGFRLGNTLSDNGSVTRGLCHITDGKLTGVTETHNIFKTADGAESREDGQPAEKLDLNELVSMNMWGLTPAFMDTLYDGFVEFLQNVKAGDIKAEYLLPVMIDALIQKGTAQVDVLETKDAWFGVTYQEDKEVVIKAFKELTEAGVYPNGLYK